MVDYKVIEDKFFRYRLVFPIKKDENKPFSLDNIEWFNFLTGGSWGNIIMVVLIVLTMVGLVLAYKHDTAALIECCNSACHALKAQADGFIPSNINLSKTLNFSNVR